MVGRPTRDILDHLTAELEDLERIDAKRHLTVGEGLDLSSNDYLGLAADPRLRERCLGALAVESQSTLGAPASRLLRGHDPRHGRLEERFAVFKGHEASLLFASGYQANVGLMSTLLRPGDRAISDSANHASLIDGLRLARCHKVIVPHLDIEAIERALAEPWPGRTVLVTESLYSMDGDIAPLDRYADLCDAHNAALVVDDAHATGVYGEFRGSGLVEHFGVEERVLATTSTFGKALGLSGAFVSGSTTLVDFLVNRCRAFIFTTAVPPLQVIAMESALDLLGQEPWRRTRVLELADRLRQRLRAGSVTDLGTCGVAIGSPIIPVILGDNARALEAAETLRREGFDVRAIRPPTVAPGTARLRLSIHADHSEADLDRLADLLVQVVAPEAQEVLA